MTIAAARSATSAQSANAEMVACEAGEFQMAPISSGLDLFAGEGMAMSQCGR
jgi:hypothetical protein